MCCPHAMGPPSWFQVTGCPVPSLSLLRIGLPPRKTFTCDISVVSTDNWVSSLPNTDIEETNVLVERITG